MKNNNSENKASRAFFLIPKALIKSPEYSSLNSDARLLYALMLDRTSLSTANGWRDENGKTFIYYTVENIASDLNCGMNKAVNTVTSLVEAGLIKKIKTGQGKPVRYYVEIEETCFSEINKLVSSKSQCNNTEMNNTEMSNILFGGCEEDDVREMIEYDCLVYTESKSELDNIVRIISDTLKTVSRNIRIGSVVYPAATVKKRLLSLNSEHISYVLEQIYSNKSQIRDIKAYILKLLFNASATIDLYYAAKYAEKNN